MSENTICGTPPMLLLPAKEYKFRIDDNNYIIELPRRGSYHDLSPDIFSIEDGEFNILDEQSNTLYTPSITKVLFATGKYPDLGFNQFFVPYSISFKEELVVLVGQIISMIPNIKETTKGEVK